MAEKKIATESIPKKATLIEKKLNPFEIKMLEKREAEQAARLKHKEVLQLTKQQSVPMPLIKPIQPKVELVKPQKEEKKNDTKTSQSAF